MKQKIDAIRVNLGMSQSDFCKAIGLNINTYRRKIKSGNAWKYDEILKISKISGVPIQDIQVKKED